MFSHRLLAHFGLVLILASAPLAGAGGVDANRASAADLDAISGVGPSMLERILSARQERAFTDWNDFSNRVRGVGPATAQRLSDSGLTINGHALGQEPARAPQRWLPMLPQPLEPLPGQR